MREGPQARAQRLRGESSNTSGLSYPQKGGGKYANDESTYKPKLAVNRFRIQPGGRMDKADYVANQMNKYGQGYRPTPEKGRAGNTSGLSYPQKGGGQYAGQSTYSSPSQPMPVNMPGTPPSRDRLTRPDVPNNRPIQDGRPDDPNNRPIQDGRPDDPNNRLNMPGIPPSRDRLTRPVPYNRPIQDGRPDDPNNRPSKQRMAGQVFN